MAEFLFKNMKLLLKELYLGKIISRMAHQKTPYYAIRLGHKAAVKLFEYMYDDTNLYLERKYNKFMKGINYGS